MSVSVVADLGDDFAGLGSTTSTAMTRRTGRSPRSMASISSRRSIVMYDAKTLTVSML